MAMGIKKMNHTILRRKFIISLFIFFLIAVPVNIALWVSYNKELHAQRNVTEMHAVSMINLQSSKIGSDFELIVADLMFFAGYNQLLDALDNFQINKNRLIEDISLFSRGSKIFDQIRIINIDGFEIIRIDYKNNKPVVIINKQLQFKGKRYYFEDTLSLDKGDIFVSPFDLNIEHGQIEEPLKPMIRFGTPIFDRHNKKRGILIFNYLGINLINDIEALVENSPGLYMLLNSKGYWIVGEDSSEWGFMYKDKMDITIGNTYPDAWKRISASDSGQFYNKKGLFTFTTVYPILSGWISSTGSSKAFAPSEKIKKAKEYYWKIVSYLPEDVLRELSSTFFTRYAYVSVVSALFLMLGAWFLSSAKVHKDIALLHLSMRTDELAKANESLETRVAERTDEIERTNVALRKTLSEKDILLKELYHRTKNNMQVINGLLTLQSNNVQEEKIKNIFKEMIQRIEAMALVHQKLYQSLDLSHIDLKSYFYELIEHIKQTCSIDHERIHIIKDIVEMSVVIDVAIPCGLILTELLNNVLKHAFPGNSTGEATIGLYGYENDEIELVVRDNGVGFNEKFDIKQCQTMGLRIVYMISEHQLDGTVQLETAGGFDCRIRFKNILYEARV